MSARLDNILHEWTLAKYARFIEKSATENRHQNPDFGGDTAAKASVAEKGSWQHFSGCEADPLKISILNTSHMTVTRGKVMLENHQLVCNAGQLRAAGKADSLMFMVKIQNCERRFRLRFPSEQDPETGVPAAQQCAGLLAKFMAIEYKTDKPGGSGDGAIPVAEVAKMLMQRPAVENLGRAYHCATVADSELDTALHLCLTDSTFPDFVSHVEQKLREITQATNPLDTETVAGDKSDTAKEKTKLDDGNNDEEFVQIPFSGRNPGSELRLNSGFGVDRIRGFLPVNPMSAFRATNPGYLRPLRPSPR